MLILQVFIHVKPECVEAFKASTMENVSNSLREPGVARFEFLQQRDDPAWFTLIEEYRTQEDHARHRETPHYAKWRETVAEMMAEPRTSAKYERVFPAEGGRG